MENIIKLDYALATRRANELTSREHGSWAHDANGTSVGLWSPDVATLSRDGAILRAIEEQVGRGRATSRQYSTVLRRLTGKEAR